MSKLECGCEEDRDTPCYKCCEHNDVEDRCCCDCGKDMTEDMMAAAYDRYKDRMKYGE